MKPLFSDPAKFAAYFNNKVPGAYRKVTPEDIRLWTECGLIHRYGYYGPTGDVEIVRGILKALEAEELQSKHAVSQDRQERERLVINHPAAGCAENSCRSLTKAKWADQESTVRGVSLKELWSETKGGEHVHGFSPQPLRRHRTTHNG